MTTVRGALLVGGPGHGRLVALQPWQFELRVPCPQDPFLSAMKIGDGYLAPMSEVVYRPRELFIFNRVLRIWAPEYMCDSALAEAAFDVLLSDDAKGVAL